MTSAHTLLKQARTALQAGHRREAGQLLARAVRQEPDNFRIWLLLATLAPTTQDAANCIARAEALAPDATAVVDARHWLAERQAAPAAAPIEKRDEEPAGEVARPVAAVSLSELRAASAAQKRRRPRRWLAIAAGVALLLVILVAGALLLPRWLNPEQPAETPVSHTDAVVAVSDDRPVANATVAADEPAPAPTGEPLPAGASPATPTAVAVRALGKELLTGNDNVTLARWTPTPTPPPTATPLPTPTPAPTLVPTFVSSARSNVAIPVGVRLDERWIDVNLSTQTLAAYEGNRLVYSTLISSGLANTPTVTGQFRVYLRFQAQTMDGARLGYDYYLPNVPYVMYFYEDYALHGTYWHNNFGSPMSHGCVNLETGDAQWIFEWAGIGTLVNVHY